MDKPYKLTPVQLTLSPIQYFEDNLIKFLNERILPIIKLILLQDALRQVDKHKPYHMRLVNISVIDKKEMSFEDSGTTTITLPKEENSKLSSVGNLMPHSHHEQSKKLLTYLMESQHNKVNSKGKRIIIQGKIYYLLDLIYVLVTNCKGLLSFDDHLYNFFLR